MTTIAQSAGRACILLLQNKDLPANAQRALEELQQHRVEMIDGEPELHAAEPRLHPDCEVPDCYWEAAYEGWARKIDPFTGKPSGMMRTLKTCESHKRALIGFQQEETA